MGFRFRKSKKIGPVRINVSKKGIGWSCGNKWFRYTKKAGGGSRTTTSIPGTGISYVKDYGKGNAKRNHKKATPVLETSVVPSGGSPAPNPHPKGVGSGCLMWCLTIFLLFSFLAFFFSLTSILCLVAGLLILPVLRWQDFLSRYIPSQNKVRGLAAAGLFLLAVIFYGIPLTAPAGVTETPSPTPALAVATLAQEPSPSPIPVTSAAPTPTPSLEPTPTPTLQPTAMPSPTPVITPAPTRTPEPTPVPTPVPTPEPTPVITPEPVVTAAPEPVVTADNSSGGTEIVSQENQGTMVWIAGSGNGKRYHSYSGCSNMKNPVEVSLSDAQAWGYTACKKCY